MKKKVLLTGATGFVGANLCRRLLREGHEVFCLVRPEYTRWRIEGIEKDIRLCVVDLTDAASLGPLIAQIRPDWVFHLAAYGAYSWETDLVRIVHTNVLGTINLVQACLEAGFEKFINTGTSSEYGFKNHAPAPTEWLDPNSYYAVTKASATMFCRYTANRLNVCIPTLRLYSVYGPFEDRGRFIPTVIARGLKGLLPPLVDATVARDFINIRDVENAYLLLANQPDTENAEVYNLGTGVQTTVLDVVQLALRVFNLNVEPQWGTMPNRQWDTSIWKADNRTLLAAGWRPELSFEQGFTQMADWFLKHPELNKYYAGA